MTETLALHEDRAAAMAAVIGRMEYTLEQVDKLLAGDDFDPREIKHLRGNIASRLREASALFSPPRHESSSHAE
jgi:hypothetical protein